MKKIFALLLTLQSAPLLFNGATAFAGTSLPLLDCQGTVEPLTVTMGRQWHFRNKPGVLTFNISGAAPEAQGPTFFFNGDGRGLVADLDDTLVFRFEDGGNLTQPPLVTIVTMEKSLLTPFSEGRITVEGQVKAWGRDGTFLTKSYEATGVCRSQKHTAQFLDSTYPAR